MTCISEDEIQFGIVAHFDNRYGKKFGWITICDDNWEKTEAGIWFHYNDGVFVEHDDFRDALVWGTPVTHHGERLDLPVEGSRVVFESSPSKRGPRAEPWTSAELYLQHHSSLFGTYYRIIDVRRGDDRSMWEGSLSRLKYAPLQTFDGELPDTLGSHMVIQLLKPASRKDPKSDRSMYVPAEWMDIDTADEPELWRKILEASEH